MTFAAPAWLALLAPAAAVAWYIVRVRPRGEAAFRYAPLPPLRDLAHPASAWWRLAQAALRAAALALLVLALARPQQGVKDDSTDIQATDILLCLDVSDSMRAEDFAPKNRMQVAREAARRFIEKRGRDRIGLVLFGQFAMTHCPLTTDHGALVGLLEQVDVGAFLPGSRTAIGDGLATCVERLKATPARSKVVILLTDGSSNAGSVDPVTAAKAAQAYGIKVYAIGAGAPGGGFMTVRDPFFGARKVRVADSLDEETLERVATATGGRSFRATDTRGLHRIFEDIDRLEKTGMRVRTFTDYLDRFEWFLLPALLLVAAELGVGRLLIPAAP